MVSIVDVLNEWAYAGIFSHVIPFLLIFAVVFGILQKSGVLGSKRGIDAIVAIAIGALALQFDLVPSFFGEIFPRFGVGLAVFLVLIILAGLFMKKESDGSNKAFYIIGLVISGAVVLWAFGNWNTIGGFGLGGMLEDYFIWIITLVLILVGVGIVVGSGKPETTT